jgi:transposase
MIKLIIDNNQRKVGVAYYPKLNPIERMWKLVKEHATHNRYFHLLSDLKRALENEFNKYIRNNEKLRNLCVIT